MTSPSVRSVVLVAAAGLSATLGAALGVWWSLSRRQEEEEEEEPKRDLTKAAARKRRREAAREAAAQAAAAIEEGNQDTAVPTVAVAAAKAAPRRDVVHADALEWLKPGAVPPGALVFTGIPDLCEVQNFAPSREAWETFFKRAAKCVLEVLPPGGVAVLVETDVREPGIGQVSKLAMVLQAATEVEGVRLLWHKVAHFGQVDESCQGSVKFSNLVCFKRMDHGEPEVPCGIPDVLWRGVKPRGLKNAVRCFGVNMTRAVLLWASRQLGVDTVVDPFCGAGTVLAVANALGLYAIGVDVSPRRVKQATQLDGDALIAYEQDVTSSASHAQSVPGELRGGGVKLSSRACKRMQGFKGMSKTLLKAPGEVPK